jgi:hypothetical protein
MNKTISNVTVKDATKGTVEAIFSRFNVVDKDGDVTLPGAFKDGDEVVISAYGHQSHFGRLPVGKGVIEVVGDEYAKLNGQFFLDTADGKDTFQVVKNLGPLGEWSYSLNNVKSHFGTFDDQQVNFLESIFVKEVSPVLMGAGVGTQTLGTKSLHDQITLTVEAVKQAINSAERVVALRAEKGKTLSNVNTEGLAGLDVEIGRLKSLLDAIKDNGSEEATHEIPEDIKALALQFRRSALFSSLPQIGA